MAVRAQVASVNVGVAGGVRAQVAKVAASVAGGVRAQVSRVRASITGAMEVTAGLGGVANPFDVCQLSAVVTTTGMTADSWTWTQVIVSTEPAVTLIGSGNTRQYVAPGTFDGCALTFRATATAAGLPDSSATVVHNIKAHAWDWRMDATGNWFAVPALRNPSVPLAEDLTAYGAGEFGSGPFGG